MAIGWEHGHGGEHGYGQGHDCDYEHEHEHEGEHEEEEEGEGEGVRVVRLDRLFSVAAGQGRSAGQFEKAQITYVGNRTEDGD